MFAEYSEPESLPTQHQLADAYVGYLEGLLFQDIEQIRSTAHVIGQTDVPFYASGVLLDGIMAEGDILDGAFDRYATGSYLSNALRSYVYSGIKLETQTVLTVTQALGHDRKWLRDTVAPSPTVLRIIMDIEDRDKRRELHGYGRRAVSKLGLNTKLGKVVLLADRFII